MKNKNVIEAMNWRGAIKEFDSEKKISEKDLEELEEVLRLTPSSFGLQPWKFLVISNKELREKLLPAANNQNQVIEASHLVVLCAKTKIDEEHIEEYLDEVSSTRGVNKETLRRSRENLIGFIKRNDEKTLEEWSKEQVFIALGTLIMASAIKGIDATPMGGFSKKEFDKILQLRENGLASVVICALGYRKEGDKYSKMKKVRFKKEVVVEEIK